MPSEQVEYSIEQLEAQPAARFSSFSQDDAVRLGEFTVEVIREWGVNLAVEVLIGDVLVFRALLGSTGQKNIDIMAGKRLVATRFRHSSLLARLKRDADPGVAEGLGDEYMFWGGTIPIYVGDEIVALISSSGEADVVDHAAVAEALDRFALARAE